MKIDTVIFDLDGTLVDSAPLISQILNGMRKERGKEPLPVGHFRQWISCGAHELIEQSMDVDGDNVSSLLEEFRQYYRQLPTPDGALFRDAFETIKNLTDLGIKLAVCSNKPSHLCRKVLAETKLDAFFDVVVGGDTVDRAKPERDPIDYVLKLLGTTPSSTILVGDSTVDQKTAENAGVRFAFFPGGYDDGVDLEKVFWQVDTLSDLFERVKISSEKDAFVKNKKHQVIA